MTSYVHEILTVSILYYNVNQSPQMVLLREKIAHGLTCVAVYLNTTNVSQRYSSHCICVLQRHNWVLPNWQHSRSTACVLLSDHGYLLIQAFSKRWNRTLGICSDPISYEMLSQQKAVSSELN